MNRPAPVRIALVDDDDMLRAVLAGNLGQAGYRVEAHAEPQAALAALAGDEAGAGGQPDLIILDWKMPGMSGLELLQQLRQGGVAAPALFFTSHNDTIYEEAALSCGAVDFIDKTRSFAILLKRIEMILERAQPATAAAAPAAAPAETLDVGPLSLDIARHTTQWRGRKVELTFGEFRVVELLARAGRDVPYREIYDALRGENFIAGEGPDGYRANVRALIKRIREKFGDADPDFAAIANYPGFGYRWVGETAAADRADA